MKQSAGIIVKVNNRCLVCKRAVEINEPSKWAIPMGGIEEGEDPKDKKSKTHCRVEMCRDKPKHHNWNSKCHTKPKRDEPKTDAMTFGLEKMVVGNHAQANKDCEERGNSLRGKNLEEVASHFVNCSNLILGISKTLFYRFCHYRGQMTRVSHNTLPG